MPAQRWQLWLDVPHAVPWMALPGTTPEVWVAGLVDVLDVLPASCAKKAASVLVIAQLAIKAFVASQCCGFVACMCPCCKSRQVGGFNKVMACLYQQLHFARRQ